MIVRGSTDSPTELMTRTALAQPAPTTVAKTLVPAALPAPSSTACARMAAQASWDAHVRPALLAIADEVAPLFPPVKVAWAQIGRTDAGCMAEVQFLKDAIAPLNALISGKVAEIASLTQNSPDSIRSIGAPRDEFDVWFSGSQDPAEYLRCVAHFRSFNVHSWSARGWRGYGTELDLSRPATMIA